ncbi:hypothetical protein C7212DRAFT_362709 [Tuber magnatum]|uniref:HIT-type domain-containing protein n=1 Tax=Tuber magnatum TaxID=42249 RepID=A0A317ST28_9PEZI|nr:hypothetical protein C7212DRAFT_362709 [Tuber magnatum]
MSASIQEESLTALCPLCHSCPPKYRCPACATRTCSVACVKKHKLYAQCSGQIDATAFVKRSTLLSSPATLNRDFGFLAGVEKALGSAVEQGDDGAGGGRGRLEDFLKRSGVSVKWAPRGMKRAVENCTAVSKGRKGKHVIWTVEWILLNPWGIGETVRVLDRNVSENTPISRAYLHPTPPTNPTNAHEESDSQLQPPRKKVKKNGQDTLQTTKFYLKEVGCPANSPVLIKLDGSKPLSVALRGRVVEEFPTILVWKGDGDPMGYGIKSGILIEVVDEGEGGTGVKAETEAAPAEDMETTEEVKQACKVPDHNTDIPQTIEPPVELASTRQSITPKSSDENAET